MKEKQIAIEAVLDAARLCQRVQRDMVHADALEKEDRSPVTVADFGSQALICRAIRQAFPEDVIVAEEDSKELQANDSILQRVARYVSMYAGTVSPHDVCHWIDEGNGEVGEQFWTLDPIDGTKGFLRDDQYAVALALLVNGKITLGVLACPNLPARFGENSSAGVLFVAVRGQGVEMIALDGEPMGKVSVSHQSRRFAESFVSAHGDHTTQEAIVAQLGITDPPIRMDSQAKYGLVARGDAAIYLRLPNPATPDYRECIWDHAAGALVVEEAGGKVTDAAGEPLNFLAGRRMIYNRGIVATNGVLHAQVLEAIRQHA